MTNVELIQRKCISLRAQPSLFVIMGEKGCSRHLGKTGKDGGIYGKDAEGPSLRGFCLDKKQVVSKTKNMLAFLHLEIINGVCSRHPVAVYSFLHASENIQSMQIILKRSAL